MIRFLLACFIGWLPAPVSGQTPDSLPGAPRPVWIWSGDERNGAATARFSKAIVVEEEVETAMLRVTSDFARLRVGINGKTVAELEPYDPVLEMPVRELLGPGKNRVEIRADGVPGPSAVAAALRIRFRNGASVGVVSGPDWLEDGGACPDLGMIAPERWALNELPEVSPVAEYNQWREAKPGSVERLSPLPDGFVIEKLRTAREGEGSWVSMVFDDRGRIIVARERQGLLRFTLPESDAKEIGVEVIEDSLEECRGLAWKDGMLFANANNSKGLYRLRDTTGDDQFDEVTLLRETGGKVGHGRNDLALGPDGRIHAIHGDVVLVPEDAERRTVPEPGAPGELGHQVSTTPGGRGWLIHNRGLRNPYGIDFHPDGEAFTYDADNEGDVGLPFYRPTRIHHLVSGGNYGWHQERGNTRNMPVYAPDSLPGTFDVGRGSPTAVKFGTRSAFPVEFRDDLFALDWAYGRIIRVALVPRGASYYGSGEVFLEGWPLNVTDLDFDARGDLYFVTGGRKTQASLYRIRYRGEPGRKPPPSDQARARAAYSAEARQRRRSLEAFHGSGGGTSLAGILKEIGDPDPWIRNAARVALEWRDPDHWRKEAMKDDPGLKELTMRLALVRSEGASPGMLRQLAGFGVRGWARPEKLTLLRLYEYAGEDALRPLTSEIEGQIGDWVDSISDPVRREAVRVLAMAEAPLAVPAGIRLASEAGDQLERLHYLEVLGDAVAGWTPERRGAYFTALSHAKRFSRGDRFMAGFFQSIENSALKVVKDDAMREHFASMLEGEQEPVPETEPRAFVRNWALEDFPGISEQDFSGRNPDRGREAFRAALCSRCHVAGREGRPVGPDLTRVASRLSRRDLLEAILEPSKVVAEVHRNVVIEKNDGSTVSGRLIRNDFRKSLIYLSEDPFLPGRLSEIPKAEIRAFERSPVSPMPPGLLNTLSRDEILDLLAWLESPARE